jgi:hypothetical protein
MTSSQRQSVTQLTITSEGGHTSGKECSTSEGAGSYAQPFSQDEFWDMGNTNQAIALDSNHWTKTQMKKAVLHPVTGKEMEYTALMKDPVLQPLWKRGFGIVLLFSSRTSPRTEK